MKFLISLSILIWQWNSMLCDPGLIDLKDLPDFRKPNRLTYSTKLPSINAITDNAKTTTPPTTLPTTPNFNPSIIKITHEDVVTGSNSVYGSQLGNHQHMTNGGIIFAISSNQGSTSQPIMSGVQPQPVLMQYLSAQGTPQQSGVQYIQLLRPIMMVPAQPYLPARPQVSSSSSSDPEPQTRTTSQPSTPSNPSLLNPYRSYTNQPLIGSYSSPYSSFLQTSSIPISNESPAYNLDLNTNEYVPSVPAASSQHISTVLAPRSSLSLYGFRHNKYQTRPQRA